MNSNYENILKEIKSKEYGKCHKKEWGGADTLFISNPNDFRANDNSLAVFVTKNVSSVVWLVEKIKGVSKVDYISKYALYNKLATVGREYEKVHGDSDVEGLLIAMLDSIVEFI